MSLAEWIIVVGLLITVIGLAVTVYCLLKTFTILDRLGKW